MKPLLQSCYNGVRLLLLSLFGTLLVQGAAAQLVADFSLDRNAGCAPLPVQFTDKTTGASVNARYQWELGNGNTSTLKSPGATYRTSQTYTVTLTVTDGALSSRKTATVTVYKQPQVNFNVLNGKGCFPLPAQFVSETEPGDGTITHYTWDFGDGNVVRGTADSTALHTYRFAGSFDVSLTVANSMGCVATSNQASVVTVPAGVKAAFTLDKKYLCAPGDAVQFTNTSSGDSLRYRWDFGDGTTSTTASPRHVYSKAGSFPVKLIVTNSLGCTSEVVLPGAVQVANFTADIQGAQIACAKTEVSFKAITSPAADSLRWDFGAGQPAAYTPTASTRFQVAGSRNVLLTAYWGRCSTVVGSRIQIADAPALTGMVQKLAPSCQLPYTLTLEDSSASDSRTWQVQGQPAQTGRTAIYTFAEYGSYPVTLQIKNAAGCTNTVTRTFDLVSPEVKIVIAGTTSRFGTADCIGLKIRFKAEAAVPLTSYRWDFGDGGASTAASPEHTFSKPGHYNVVLRYITATGCTDTAMFREVAVYSKPKIDFTGPAEVCSSNPVGFTATTDTMVRKFYWYYGDNTTPDTATNINNYVQHKYTKEGVYDVTLVANYGGVCADTVTKRNFITVKAPFQAIQNIIPDCSGDQQSVNLHIYTRYGVSSHFRFGDGVDSTYAPGAWQSVPHHYPAPGVYMVYHSTTNGSCTAVDSAWVFIPGRQQVRLEAASNRVCTDQSLELTLQGVRELDLKAFFGNKEQFKLAGLEYGDGSAFEGQVQVLDSNWAAGYRVRLTGLARGKSGLRAIISSLVNGCTVRSELFPLTIVGPQAAIGLARPATCFTDAAVFRDASLGDNIRSWEWQVADSTLAVRTRPDSVVYRFIRPGVYPVLLKVTDTDGCTSTTEVSGGVRMLGVKAGFTLPDTLVAINAQLEFANTSVAINGAEVAFQWTYANGSRTSAAATLVHRYTQIGRDTIRLVARTTEGGCADTVVQTLHHDNIYAKFTYSATYINNNACPPMLVKFTNRSRGDRANLWTFGDGSSARNQLAPERTYRVGGTYKVTLYTFGPGTTVDSTSEYITVKGPSARITADRFSGCLQQQVTLKADVAYARDYYWDFGDGSVLRTRDTVARHHYATAGVYLPSLVLSDSTGCSVSAELAQPVVIDSLSIRIGGIPPLVCDAARLTLQPKVISVAADRMNQALDYRWQLPSGSSRAAAPTIQVSGEGRYAVQVTATSVYGCVQTAYDTVVVRRTVKGTITGTAEVCAGKEIRFTATIPGSGSSWRWLMPGGGTGTGTQSPAVQLADSGYYPVRFVVNHDGCIDTAKQTLWVHPIPVIRVSAAQPRICRGATTVLQANGGATYRWTSTEPIQQGAATHAPQVAPLRDAWYKVAATSIFGCQQTDSVRVQVTQPFRMSPVADTFVCRGGVVQLKAKGAAVYRWSGPAGTLNTESGASIEVRPTVASRYRVVGTDSVGCFNDTAYAQVRIEELPLVQTGPDRLVMTGSEVRLLAKVSPDVVRYEWAPRDAVQCNNCAQTTAQPRKDMAYTLAVANGYGCVARDTLKVRLQCAESNVFIPNAFTPDRDGLNETFNVRGRGATVKTFRIFDRWGSMVFQSENVQLNATSGGWDGTSNGRKVPAGTYAYVVELVCDTGTPFVQKGTVTVIR